MLALFWARPVAAPAATSTRARPATFVAVCIWVLLLWRQVLCCVLAIPLRGKTYAHRTDIRQLSTFHTERRPRREANVGTGRRGAMTGNRQTIRHYDGP